MPLAPYAPFSIAMASRTDMRGRQQVTWGLEGAEYGTHVQDLQAERPSPGARRGNRGCVLAGEGRVRGCGGGEGA